MKKIDVKIVIGSNYGDEGKGLATHYFAQNAEKQGKSCLNVLFNGGPQRGHTVEMTDGRRIFRHICHHIGAGLFDGASTYFDKDFMISPIFFTNELESLADNFPGEQYEKAQFYISPECRVITPYDSFINQIVELQRHKKHGSCGFGIWETQQRYDEDRSAWRYESYKNASDKEISKYLKYISRLYVPARLKNTYGIEVIPSEYREIIESEHLINRYIRDLRKMQDMVEEYPFDELAELFDTVVFEGAQGLALDEGNVKAYPHVTASKTGSFVPVSRIVFHNADIEICYITRSYFTKHGAGPFPTECHKADINSEIIDATNPSNRFQGSIRYGKFDGKEFLDRVNSDFKESEQIMSGIKKSIFVTHLNYTNNLTGGYTIENISGNFDTVYYSRTRFAEDVIKRSIKK